jgi:uncharacterized protein YecE (DUF72 family)
LTLTDEELLAQAGALAARAPEPAAVGNVLAGTAGWTDRTLVESHLFYPRSVGSAAERLAFYARHFCLVEVDSTYYALLPSSTADRWLAVTPPEFVFDVKAFPVFTGHPLDVARLPPDLRKALELAVPGRKRVYPDRLPAEIRAELGRRFVSLVEPLHAQGRLGCVMAQFPPWFTATRANARRLEHLRMELGELPVSIEFRHSSWLLPERQGRVLDLLRAQGFSYVGVDEPKTRVGGLPALAVVTNPRLALVRFHGRNRLGWETAHATVHQRFGYVYSPEELETWLDPLRRLSTLAEHVHAVFNNCVSNYAVLGAKGMAALLQAQANSPSKSSRASPPA